MAQRKTDEVAAECLERMNQRTESIIKSAKDSLLDKMKEVREQFASVTIESNSIPAKDDVPENSVNCQLPSERPNTSMTSDFGQLNISAINVQANPDATVASPEGARSELVSQKLFKIDSANQQKRNDNNTPRREGQDLLLWKLADRLSVSSQHQLALELGLQEHEINPIRRNHKDDLTRQIYEILQVYCRNSAQPIPGLITALKETKQKTVADWLIERQEPNLAAARYSGSPSASEPSNSVRSNSRDECYEESSSPRRYHIYFAFTEEARTHDLPSIDKCRDIFKAGGWKVHEHGQTERLGDPVTTTLGNILTRSNHLVVLYSKADCQTKERSEMTMLIEMAFQKAYDDNELGGKIIPLYSCERKHLPLHLKALSGSHIDDGYLEKKIKESILRGASDPN
ncbi:uncharacterized protein [Diadema antillarum]|uniref:uncharacterized protein n=1 Tax=Diadema antillarum TaxID=105358 RepID=UPI003A861F1F